MLSPQTITALHDALKAVVDECGDDPQYADLVQQLDGAQDALARMGDDHHEPAPDEGDDYSFDEASKRMTAKRKGVPIKDAA